MKRDEDGVIGCILQDPESVALIYNILKPDMFTYEFAKACFKELLSCYDRGKEINPMALAQMVERDDMKGYDRESVVTYIKICLEECDLAHNDIMTLANGVVKEYRKNVFKRIFSTASLNPSTIDQTIAKAILELEALTTGKEVTSRSLKDIVKAVQNDYFVEGKDVGIKMGFTELDDKIGVLEKGDVTVIGARPAVGKSALAVNIAIKNAEKGYHVGYFNLEMNDNQVYERVFAYYSDGIALNRLRKAKNYNGDTERNERKRVDTEISKLNITVSTGSKTVGQIRSESRHMSYDLIIIDYLQLILSEVRYAGNRASEVGAISKAIKSMAMELKVPIILLSQMNRASEMNPDREPEMSELRESGDIEQDASTILLAWNIDKNNREYKGLKICKNRQGELSKQCLIFDGSHMKFTERIGKKFDELKAEASARAKNVADMNKGIAEINEKARASGKVKYQSTLSMEEPQPFEPTI